MLDGLNVEIVKCTIAAIAMSDSFGDALAVIVGQFANASSIGVGATTLATSSRTRENHSSSISCGPTVSTIAIEHSFSSVDSSKR